MEPSELKDDEILINDVEDQVVAKLERLAAKRGMDLNNYLVEVLTREARADDPGL